MTSTGVTGRSMSVAETRLRTPSGRRPTSDANRPEPAQTTPPSTVRATPSITIDTVSVVS